MASDSHPFTLPHYRAILDSASRAGYRFATFAGPDAHGRRIYLRHDIDNDVPAAHRMARLEEESGVRATYLVMLRSANYNPAEARNVRLLREMAGMGHELGLHFSLVDHPDGGRDGSLTDLIARDAELLGQLIDRQVRVFGFHNPADEADYRIEVPALVNTYAARFFDDACYVSESNMRWRKGCPCETLQACDLEVVQLLVHPLSFADELSSDRDVLMYFLGVKLADLLEYNASQNRVLREDGLRMADFLTHLQRAEGAK